MKRIEKQYIIKEVTSLPKKGESSTFYMLEGTSITELYRFVNGNWQPTSVGGGVGGPITVKVSLSAAQIKTLGTTPIKVIAAPGAGMYINILSVQAKLNYVSVAFDDNQFNVSSNASFPHLIIYSALSATSSNLYNGILDGGDELTIYENTAVSIYGTDSVATGDSTIDFYITYQIITL